MDLSAEQVEAFRHLEESLWSAETRGDRTWMDAVLSPNSTEHSRSGDIHSRDEILAVEVLDPISVELPLTNFAARLIDSVSVLVTYTCRENGDHSTRASLWCHDGTQWRLEFHQGTPIRRQRSEPPRLATSEIREARFGISVRGYSRAHVDRFMQDVSARIDAGDPPDPADIARTRFELSLRGYETEEVDEFMARIKEGLS